MENDIKQTLLKTSEGLLFPSESDYPFEYVEWQTESSDLSKKEMRQLSGLSSGVPVQLLTLEKLFHSATKTEDWHGEEEKANIARFVNLQQALETNLTDIHVFKAGKTEADVFIVGKDATGKWMGLSTKVVET